MRTTHHPPHHTCLVVIYTHLIYIYCMLYIVYPVGATNLPQELDEAVLRLEHYYAPLHLPLNSHHLPPSYPYPLYRRLVKRIYVPLPDPLARRALIKHLILKHHTAHHTSSSGSSGPSSTKASPDKTTTTSTAITTTSNATVTKKNDKVMNKLTSLILGADSSRSTTAVTSASSPSLVAAEDGICGFSGAELTRIVELTEGYSGSDLSAVRACACICNACGVFMNIIYMAVCIYQDCTICAIILTPTLTLTLKVCHEAAMGPIRELGFAALRTVRPEDVRPLAVRVREGGVWHVCACDMCICICICIYVV